MKKIMALLLASMLILTLSSCSGATVAQPELAATAQAPTTVAIERVYTPISVDYDSEDLNNSGDSAEITTIRLESNAITFTGSGITVNGAIATITSAGIYNISGVLNDGQIIVNVTNEEKVTLILNGASIACSTNAPIYVMNAKKTIITLAEGTENTVSDGTLYILEAYTNEPNAAIFSNDDLTINGNGALMVNAAYNNGIASDDDLKITGGNITINAVNDGLKGKNSIAIKNGNLVINTGGDGLRSDNTQDAEKGYIVIEGGALNITAGLDGIQAETRVLISGGDIAIVTGGGSDNSSEQIGWGNWRPGAPATANDTESAKGIKALVDVTITGGNIQVDAADDALHSNGSLTINDGELLLASGDDGIHADATLTINGGNLNIIQSYEGLESAIITINDGIIHVVARDDGINVAGGADGSAMNGRRGQNMFAATGNYHLYINGGYIYVNAGGDGLDSNGPIDMTGGTVLVNGPTEAMNGALDYTGNFTITGGFLVAVGSAGMAQAPSATSTQYAVLVSFPAVQAANTMVHIASNDGSSVLTFVPTKAYQTVVLCSPELKNGATYTVYTGGSATGAVTDGLYSGGSYSSGIQITEFTISSIVTGAGEFSGGFFGGPGDRPTAPGGAMPRPGGQRP